MEYPLQPSPIRKGNLVNSPVPGYVEYTSPSTACTGAITTAVSWKLTKIGNVVFLTLPVFSGNASAAANFTLGELIPDKFRPTSASILQAVVVIDNGSAQNQVGKIDVTSGGLIIVSRNASGVGNFTAGAAAGLAGGASMNWILNV